MEMHIITAICIQFAPLTIELDGTLSICIPVFLQFMGAASLILPAFDWSIFYQGFGFGKHLFISVPALIFL